MRVVADPDRTFRLVVGDLEGDVAEAATGAMRETTYKALRELRGQVTSAGLGKRLANTWRDRIFPQKRRSMTPTGYIWSNAPDIIDSFNRGAQIVPIAGSRFLAIPTSAVPRTGGRRGSSRAMTPEQVEHHFNADLFFQRKSNGRVLAFLNLIAARNSRKGFRGQTKGRLAAGRASQQVLMFILVPVSRMPKLLDIDAVVQRWETNFTARFTARLGGE